MLEYIYTGDTNINADIALQLLIAANQYQLPHLRILVEKTLSRNVDLDNVGDLLRYAKLHNAHYLHKVCQYFIAVKFEETTKGSFWKELPKKLLEESKQLQKDMQKSLWINIF